MKLKSLLTACVIFIITFFHIETIQAQYCAGTGRNNNSEWITNVTFNTINNNSGANGANAYGNYTGQVTTLSPGQTYALSVSFVNSIGTEYVVAYFDWNNDGDWVDAGESFPVGSGANATITTNVLVPMGAVIGVTPRFRINMDYNANPTGPCDNVTYGEIEDYSFYVCAAANGIVLNSDQSICGGSLVNLDITGSIGGKTYQWQSSSDNVTFTNIGGETGSTYSSSPIADTYYRVAITSGGCTAYTNTILISVVTKPVVDAGPPQTICEGDNANLAGTSSVGQTASYSQTFNTPIPDNNAAWTSKTFAVAGLYPATMNDASFVSIASVCINLSHTWNSDLQIQLVSPSGTAINLANNNGGSGAGFTNVCFKTAAAATINVAGATAFNGDYRPLQAFNLFDGDAVNGNWVIRIRDRVGGSTGTWSFASITFNTGTTYTWSPAGTLSNANILNPVATPVTTTDYTLTVANGSCSTSDVVKITVQPKPNTSIISGTADLCAGTSSAYSVINTPGNNYTWSVTGGGGVSGGQGSNNATINWTTAGTWQVKVLETGANGCPDSQVSKSVTVYDPPTIFAGRDTTLCTNEDVVLGGTPTASGGSSTFNYLWSPATELSATNIANPIANPTANRAYTLTVTDVTSNCVSVDNVNITMVTPVTASAGANKTICERSSVTIGDTPTAANGSANYSYNWIPATNISSTSVANPSVSPTVTTVYTVTVTDNMSGCTDVSNVTVNVNPAPTGSISSNTPQCDGFEADFDLTASSNDGNTLSYAWTDNNGWTSTIEDPKRNDPFPAMNRAHEVVLTNDLTGCTSVLISHPFEQVDRPIAPTLTANKLTFCPGEDLTLTNNQKRNLLVDPVFDYYFGGPNGWTSTVNDSKGTITATRTLTGADGGDYWLVIQAGDQSVCMSDTVFITITVFDPGSFTAVNNGPICHGQDLQLDVTDGGVGVNYSWTGPNGFGPIATRNSSRLAVDAATDFGVYTVNINNGTCPAFNVTTNVQIDSPRNPGANNTVGICETETNFDLITGLGGTPEVGGTWNDDTPSNTLTVDKFDASGLGGNSYNFTYTLLTSNTCPDQSATLTVDVSHQTIAGVDNTIEICNTVTDLDLFALLGVTAETGGVWTNVAAAGTLTGNLWDATGVVAGSYDFDYTTSSTDCPDATATITVTVIEELNAGVNTSFEVCEDGAMVILFNELNGSPDAGGAWTDLSGTTGFSVNQFDPTAGDGPGSYDFKYTVTSPSCAPKSTTLTVNVRRLPIAGNDGAETICNTENAFDLFTALGTPYDAGGTWNNVSGQGSLTGNTWDATGVAAGNYNFTYTVSEVTSTCSPDIATVVITVVEELNAGVNTTFEVCEDGSTVILFNELNGGPDAGGAWTDLSGTTGFTVNQFDPTAGDDPGSYDFEYTITSPTCAPKTATLTVEVKRLPVAGVDGAATICSSENAFDLFTVLGTPYDAGGSWNNDNAAGALTGNLWNANGVATGNYDFSYIVSEASGACANDVATVTITVTSDPNPGTNTSYDVCENDGLFTLLTQLNGSPDGGGSWADLSGTTGFSSTQFDPSAGDGPGSYVFEYTISVPNCPANSAQLTVESHRMPIAGDDGAVTICNSENALALFPELGGTPDAGGTWVNVSGQGTLTGSTWDATGVTAGNYNFTYTVTDPAAICANDIATVVVTVVAEPNPGINTTYDVCESDGLFTLFTQLNGSPDAGGSWTDLSGTTGFTGTQFNPSAGDGAGTYIFEYTINIASCATKSAQLTVESHRMPVAGDDGAITICNTENALALFPELGGAPDAGGTWVNVSGQGTLTGSTWDATGVTAGNYNFTYTVTDPAAICAIDVATVVVTVVEEPNPGINTTYDVCESDGLFTLLTQLNGSPDAGGTWADLSGTTGFTGAQFNPSAGDGAGTYIFEYTINIASCASKSAQLTVESHRMPIAGDDGAITICNTENALALFSELGGTPDAGGIWGNVSGQGTLTGSTWDATGVVAGNYNFTYTVTDPAAICAIDVATVVVTVVKKPEAGTAVQLNKCSSDPAFSLFTALTGNDAGGQWYNHLNAPISPTLDPANYIPGSYVLTYSVTGTPPCSDDAIDVNLFIERMPFAGDDVSINACETETSRNLFSEITGTPDVGGTWDDGGQPGSINTATGELNPSTLAPGTYNYTYTVPGNLYCNADEAVVTVTVIRTPVAGDDVALSACNGDNTDINLFNELNTLSAATPDAGGSWYNVTAGAPLASGLFNPFGLTAGVYVFEYTVLGSAVCNNDVARLTITIENQPYAGIDGNYTTCVQETAFDLFDALSGNPDLTGSWNDLSATGALSGTNNELFNASIAGPGVYNFSYTITAVTPCNSVTSFATITVTDQPDAGLNTAIEICNDRVVDLFNELDGTPHTGGDWTDNAAGTGSIVNPATFDANGIAGGTYIFRYDLTADAPCTAVNSVLTINVNEQPSAGTDGSIIACDIDPTFNLFDQLNGNPTPGGTWADSGNGSINDTINPATGLTDIYTYTPVIPNQCQLVTAAVDVTIHETPVVTFDYFCSIDALTYYIEFTVTGGDPSTYVNVSGSYTGNMGSASVSGTWAGNVFTSDDMPTKSTFTYSFTDKNGCGPTVVSEYIDCGCPSKAGEMDNNLIEVCVGIDIIAIYDDTKQVFDNNDGLNFILHDFNGPTFGNILDINRTGVAVFNFLTGMNADQTYYISAVVGNVDGSGTVNLNDTCLSISSTRTPIRFNSIPIVDMGFDQDLCLGDSRDLKFTFTGGTGDYTVTYGDNSTSTGLNNTNNLVSKTPLVTTTYSITKVEDSNGCFTDNITDQSATLTVIPLPDISMTGDITYCESTNQPTLTFKVNSTLFNPYNILVNDPVTTTDIPFTFSSDTVIKFPATGPGTFVYTLRSVVDGSTQACTAVDETRVTIVVNPTPAATITSGNKTICFNDSADIVLDFNIGTAPYTVVYNDGVNPDVVDAGIVNNPQVYTLAPDVNTTYTFKSLTDANGCVSNLIGGAVVNFTVNQLPVLNDVIVDDIELCNNDSTNLLFDITGSGDFTVDYTINGIVNQQVIDGSSTFTIKPTAMVGSNVASTYNYVVTKITDNASPYNCVSNVTDAAMVKVYPNPTGKISLTNNSICENSEAELNFEFTGVDKFNFSYEEVGGGVGNETNIGRNFSTQFVPPGNITDFSYKLIDVTSVAPSGFTCYSEINAIVDLKVQLAPVVDIEGTDIMCQKDSRELTFNITRTTWPVTIELGNDVGPSVIYNNVVDGQKVSLNPMTPTNYNVLTIIDGSPQACVGTASGVFFLDVITLPSATMTTPSKICYGDTSFLKFDFNGGRNGYIINYTDADTLKTLEYTEDIHTDSISIHPEKLTNYVLINITDKSGLGCKSQDYNLKQKVNVVPLPEAKLDGNNTICEGETSELLFYFTKGVAPFSLTYTDGISEFTVDTIQRDSVVIVAPTETTTYEITGISDGSGIGCIGKVYPGTPTIIVNKKPNVVFTVDTIQECVPFTATFTNKTPAEQISEIIWDFGDQTKSTIINGSTISHPYERAGRFKASLTVVSPENCKKTYSYPDSIIADVVPVVDFDFFPTQPTLLESQVNFYNQTKFADLYQWVVDGDTLSASENFNHLFPDDQERMYDVTLVATNDVKSQCTSANTKKVLVKGQLFLHVPNTFTPNGDNKNDVFIPVMEGYDTEEYLFEIYNRGGQLLFSTNDFSKAWDGKNNGKEIPSDLYIWKLEVKSKYLVEKEQLMGHVRLMR